MQDIDWSGVSPQRVLDFWFPDDGHWTDPETHRAFWMTRMQGGMDAPICADHADLTKAAAMGLLDHWADTPRGRLALVIALDQFPRSLWRDTPAAFGQDIKAANLCLAALDNGDWAALPNPWEKQFMVICIGHAEGPEHLARQHRALRLAIQLIDEAPAHLKMAYTFAAGQALKGVDIIGRFGRHPHRNAILGRISSPAEAAYIAEGDFPHLARAAQTAESMAAALRQIEARLAPYRNGA